MTVYEAYCTRCGRVLDTSKDVPADQQTSLLLSAQFKRCPDCHKHQDFAYFEIGVREKVYEVHQQEQH